MPGNQADLMFSLFAVGAMFGSLMAGSISHVIGRRWAIVATAVPSVVGAVMMTQWVTNAGLMIGRSSTCVCDPRYAALVYLW